MTIKVSDLARINTTVAADPEPTLSGDLDTNNNSIINDTGPVNIDGLNYPQVDGAPGQVVYTDGNGNLAFKDDTISQYRIATEAEVLGVLTHYFVPADMALFLPDYTTLASGDFIKLTKAVASNATSITAYSGQQIESDLRTDTSITYDVTDEIILIYNGTQWQLQFAGRKTSASPNVPVVLDDLQDVSTTNNIFGDGLVWDGNNWANVPIATTDQGDLADTAIQPGDNNSELVNDSLFVAEGDNVSTLVNDAGYLTSLSNTETAYIDFIDQPNPDFKRGRIFYDFGEDSLAFNVAGGEVTIQVGQEIVIQVSNRTGQPIANGVPVTYDGTQGNTVLIRPAQANSVENANVLGVTTHEIEDESSGYITTFGKVHDVDLTAYPQGALLYLAADVPGSYTTIQPNFASFVGLVLVQGIEGTLFVKINSNLVETLSDLKDVNFSVPPVADDVLMYNGVDFIASDLPSKADSTVEILSDDVDLITTGVTSALDSNVFLQFPKVNLANGIVKLGNDGKVPPSLLPSSNKNFLGTWDASANMLPPDGTANGDYYIIDTAGILNLQTETGGPLNPQEVNPGDEIVYSGTPGEWVYNPQFSITVASSVVYDNTYSSIPSTNLQGSTDWLYDAIVFIDDKTMDKDDTAISGEFATWNGTGEVISSGIVPTDFATAAQGALADTAVQVGSNISLLFNDVGYITAADLLVTSVAGKTGDVVLVEADITDLDKYSKSEVDGLIDTKIDLVTGVNSNFTMISDGQIVDSGTNQATFATAAQGARADTAIQPGDNNSELINDSGYITLAEVPPPPVTTVFGRSGAVVAVAGDYDTDDIPNTSVIVGSSTTDALNTIDTDFTAVENDIDDLQVEVTNRMNWVGEWETSSKSVVKNDVVVDGQWLMIANTATTESPSPYSTGPAAFSIPDGTNVFTTLANNSVVYSGHQYMFTEGGFATEIRAWVPQLTGDTHYRMYLVDITNPDKPKVATISDPLLTENRWATIALNDMLIRAGQKFLLYINALNSGSDTTVTGGWTSGGDKDIPPDAQSWGRDRHTTFAFDKIDLDGTDRSSELLGVTVNSELTIAQTSNTDNNWVMDIVGDPVDGGSYVEYSTIRTVNNGNPVEGAPSTCTFNIPVPQATQYVETADYWLTNQPTWATVSGFKEFDGVPQAGSENSAFGIDMEFQPAEISPDWDFMARSDIASTFTGDLNYAGVTVGTSKFNSDLGIPVWWNGTEWVDANGNEIN